MKKEIKGIDEGKGIVSTKLSRGIRVIGYFLLAAVMLFAGYLWKMSYEVESKTSVFDAGRQTVIQEIKREVKEGNVFWIGELKFVPRRDRAVNITVEKEENEEKTD